MQQAILVVESDGVLRDVIASQLRNDGYFVVALADGATAKAVAQHNPLSLVLLDLPVALPLHLIAVVLLGVLALPPIVVVDVVLALRLRARAALVPILALPVLVPQLVAATRGASAALSGDAVGALSWAGLLFAFAVVYTVVGLTIVPAAIE